MAWYRVTALVSIFCCLLNISESVPLENEWTAIPVNLPPEAETEQITVNFEKEERAYPIYDPAKDIQQPDDTSEILEKIKRINESLKKPQRQQINHNKNEPDKSFVLDEETLKKIQMLITTGKLNLMSDTQQHQDGNTLTNEHADDLRNGNPRAIKYRQLQQQTPKEPMALVPIPFSSLKQSMILLPSNELYSSYNQVPNNDLNSVDNSYTNRQGFPSLPFAIPWPLSGYFPILIKDPLLNFLQGGNWDNLVDVGQAADVCNRKQKSTENIDETSVNGDDDNTLSIEDNAVSLNPVSGYSAREGRKIKKRTISNKAEQQELNTKLSKFSKKIFGQKNKIIMKKPVQQLQPTYDDEEEEIEDTKTGAASGDLRFPFGDFTLFGNRKPVVPSPGFFINRLKVRRGGVAIAGPGGVATAGRGGTAIVGPGGLAYTQPGGMAVAGPAAKVYALSPDVDLSQIISQLQKKTANDGTLPRSHIVEGGRLVATGPVIYYNKQNQQT